MKKKLLLTVALLALIATAKSQIAIGNTNVSKVSVPPECSDIPIRDLIVSFMENSDIITDNGEINYDTPYKKGAYQKDMRAWLNLRVSRGQSADKVTQTRQAESAIAKAANTGMFSKAPYLIQDLTIII